MTYFKLAARITTDPEICHGKPCIRNMRLPVETFLKLLESGSSKESILEQYPLLEQEDLQALLEYNSRKKEPEVVNQI